MRYENYKHILFSRSDKVLTVTLNRPEQRNAINMELDVELLRQKCGQLPMAEASLQNIRAELMARRLRGPKP